MAFIRITSPHAHSATTTAGVMSLVLLALIPGICALTIYFGPGTLINIALASIFALGFEAAVLKLRNRRILPYLKDYSALVTAILLGIALPPYCPWWVIAVGIFFAIVVAKQLYGGLGFNPFNPAMVGYVILLISFPLEMTQWATPTPALTESSQVPSLLATFAHIFGSTPLDGYTAATPLDIVKQNTGLTLAGVYQNDPTLSTGRLAGAGWEWVNLAFLAGGIFLLFKKVFTWHAPVAMLLSLVVLSFLFYDNGSSASLGSPFLHLLSGGTMLGAFFIITDPVTSAVSNKGRLIYGASIGCLVFIIRVWGNYPDAIAFAVLLMNFAAPFIDYYTLPRTYGHAKSRRATTPPEE